MNGTMINSFSGIKTHQFGLDSLANNIANVNTLGYRENQPQFESLFASSLDSLNANSAINNDYNYGVTKASNAISTKSGSYKNSDGEFDVAYEGKGWFVVGENKGGSFVIKDDGYESKQKTYFTRDGSFLRDGEGYIVNSSGYYMYGVDLGKISNNVFTTSNNSDEDFAKLATGELKPLQIPQDLYFKPVLTTKVDLSINLNKKQNSVNATQVYSLPNGSFDEERFLNADLNGFAANGETLDATTFDKILITTRNNGRNQDIELRYGRDFRTFNELKNVLLERAGIGLDLTRLPDGSVPKAGLRLSNVTYTTKDITISGNLAEKLGIAGRNDSFASGVDSQYRPTKNYNNGDIVNAQGIVFRYSGESGNSNPLEDSANWEVLDTSALGEWQERTSYQVGELVNHQGNVYRRIESNGNSDPLQGGWEQVIPSARNLPQEFIEGTNYTPKSIVSYQGRLYERVSAGISNPREDKIGWRVLDNNSFESAYLEVPSYQSNVEVYDESGAKFLLQSHYYLLNSADVTTNPRINERWEVRTQLFNQDGTIALGEVSTHEIAFDENNNPITQPIDIAFGNGQIAYNIAGSADRRSANRLYQDSQILQTSQDGRSEGHLQDLRIDRDGIIFLAFTNGAFEAMGRVGISAFVNDQGLKKVGGNLFEMSEIVNDGDTYISSGRPLLGWSGQHLRFGSVLYKHLETSNVDVGNALTDLIVMQRGYSMNAKAFTTGDDLIKEAINLKR
ncbi:flagellar hook-basal body complex protein [uncultured Helicobacter sp.]|uniref:flagellar hook-basal body complex protein n=1 Tax=uncultured Helicobacter sp. TaxID=175537 RepID=UPI001C3A3555|nr:flagellar hook-basal body complex protein [Candidatus Helicobacter avicola]